MEGKLLGSEEELSLTDEKVETLKRGNNGKLNGNNLCLAAITYTYIVILLCSL